MNHDTKGILLIVLSATSFGTLGVLGKYASAADLSIPTVLAYRFLGGTLFFWMIVAYTGNLRRLRGRALGGAVLLGAGFYSVHSGLYFLGLEFMTAGLTGLVIYTYPVLVVVLSYVILDERITRYTVVGLVLALGGVAVVSGFDPAGADPIGIAVVLGAALVYAGYYVTSHIAVDNVNAQTLTAYVLPSAGASFIIFGLVTDSLTIPTTSYEVTILAAIALIGTAIPIGAFFAGLAYIGASRASIIASLEPATAVILGVILLNEPLAPATAVGGLLVLVGVLVIQRE
ncbi:DMT family transporter [Halobacterium sp. KA-6]|uniref:DMT family transporter n=1 Tax=Halobacterium sp. KA-6 TaxID=2896368 RepID=UPI001E487F5A|nr:DMT family transporter [Halobacterium sp. KA-6]MCD2204581.1 DMT family transporter [Halobacterium sp. KA-6]